MRIMPGTTITLYESPVVRITLTRGQVDVDARMEIRTAGDRHPKVISAGSLEAFSETLAYWLGSPGDQFGEGEIK